MNRGLVLLLVIAFCGVVYSQNCQSAGCGAGLCCSIHGYCGTTYEHCVSQCHSRCSGGGTTTGSSVSRGYNYQAFINAAKAFPSFGNKGDTTVKKREIAAFFAQIGHETSFLQFLEEIICRGYTACRAGDTCNTYCNGGRSYHGRGPIQLSHHYNYNAAGSAIGANLLADPNLILRDPTVGWKTALWFWMTAQSPKPSCHAVMTGGWGGDGNRKPGFGMTTNIINGGLECGGRNPSTVQSRIKYQY